MNHLSTKECTVVAGGWDFNYNVKGQAGDFSGSVSGDSRQKKCTPICVDVPITKCTGSVPDNTYHCDTTYERRCTTSC
jgi:hypothetical protein